jgi:chromosome segregation ATPase
MKHPVRLAMVVGLCVSASVQAQTARSGGGDNAQLMQQMQQLAAERTQLQADNARLKREMDELRKERDGLKGGKESREQRARASEAALTRAGQERDASARELEQLKERTQELVAKFRETIQELRNVESDRTQVKQQLGTRDTDLKSCVHNNGELITLNDEILKRFEKHGWSEPFTQIKRVQLENLAEEYRGRAEDAQVQPTPNAPAVAPAPTS